jgi:hypothetical protein
MTQAEVTYNQATADLTTCSNASARSSKRNRSWRAFTYDHRHAFAQELKQNLQDLDCSIRLVWSRAFGGKSLGDVGAQAKNQPGEAGADARVETAQRDNIIDPLSQIKSLVQESITLDVDLATSKAKEQGLKRILAGYEDELQGFQRRAEADAPDSRPRRQRQNLFHAAPETRRSAHQRSRQNR